MPAVAAIALALAALAALWMPAARAASTASVYAQLPADVVVSGNRAPLLSRSVVLARPAWVYVQSDGGYSPRGAAQANAWISIDGVPVSNDSIVDWRQSTQRHRHGFNAVGARWLAAGPHVVALHGRSAGAGVVFHAGASLAVMVDAARTVATQATPAPSPQLDFDTRGTVAGAAIPAGGWRAVLDVAAGNLRGPVVAMASGSSYVQGTYGDAMWGIFLNGAEPPLDSMTWSINDLWTGAETQAPMFSQALFTAAPVRSRVQLVATESPYWVPDAGSTNAVRYRVAAATQLLTLSGNIAVHGRALNPAFDYDERGVHHRFAYVCIGTNGYRNLPSQAHKPRCPPSGSAVVLGQGRLCIPRGHNGVVLLSARSRVQADDHDSGGVAKLWITVDGKPVGPVAVQPLGPAPHSVSTRTMGSSWLATGAQALREGCHDARVMASGSGDFRNLSMNADLPLLWFD